MASNVGRSAAGGWGVGEDGDGDVHRGVMSWIWDEAGEPVEKSSPVPHKKSTPGRGGTKYGVHPPYVSCSVPGMTWRAVLLAVVLLGGAGCGDWDPLTEYPAREPCNESVEVCCPPGSHLEVDVRKLPKPLLPAIV